MAKPTPLPPLRSADKIGEVAPRILALRVADVRRFEGGAARAEVDAVHDMRVAARRLRAALELYGFPRPLGRQVKKLQDALGALRDLQIHEAAFEEQARRSPPAARAVLRALALELRGALPPARRALGRALERWRQDTAPELGVGAPSHPRRHLGGPHYEREIPHRLKQLRRRARAFGRDARADVAHRLRIATKRLRYELELLAPVFPSAKKTLRRLVPMQELLGGLHDADVRLRFLEERGSGAARSKLLERERRRRDALARRAMAATMSFLR